MRRYLSPPGLSLTLAENEPVMGMGVYFYVSLLGMGSFLDFELHSTGHLSVDHFLNVLVTVALCVILRLTAVTQKTPELSKFEHAWAFQAGEMGRLRGGWQDGAEKTLVEAVMELRDCKADRPRIPHTL